MAIYVPKLYIDYKDFAEARGIDPQKLEYGIGIKKMALADANQRSSKHGCKCLYEINEE